MQVRCEKSTDVPFIEYQNQKETGKTVIQAIPKPPTINTFGFSAVLEALFSSAILRSRWMLKCRCIQSQMSLRTPWAEFLQCLERKRKGGSGQKVLSIH